MLLKGVVALAVAVAFALAVAATDTFRILDIYIYVYIFIDTYYFVSCFSVIVADVVHSWHAGGILH